MTNKEIKIIEPNGTYFFKGEKFAVWKDDSGHEYIQEGSWDDLAVHYLTDLFEDGVVFEMREV